MSEDKAWKLSARRCSNRPCHQSAKNQKLKTVLASATFGHVLPGCFPSLQNPCFPSRSELRAQCASWSHGISPVSTGSAPSLRSLWRMHRSRSSKSSPGRWPRQLPARVENGRSYWLHSDEISLLSMLSSNSKRQSRARARSRCRIEVDGMFSPDLEM